MSGQDDAKPAQQESKRWKFWTLICIPVLGILLPLLWPDVRVWLHLSKKAADTTTPSVSHSNNTNTQATGSVANSSGTGNATGTVAGNGNIIGNNNTVNLLPESKKKKKTGATTDAPAIKREHTVKKKEEDSPQPQINAPNGIAIGGDSTVINPTVNNNNFGSYPGPGVVPNLSVCFSERNAAKGDSFENVFTIDTDAPISEPALMFNFDGPVDKIRPDMGKGVQFMTNTNPNHPKGEYFKHPENSLIITFDNIGGLGSQAPWRPHKPVTMTVASRQAVKLLSVNAWSVQEPLKQNVLYPCGN